MLGSTCFSKPGSLGVGSQEGENQLESASTLCAHGQAPRKCSGSLKTFSLGLAEILGSRYPHVPEEPILLLSTHRCNLILGVAV